MKHADVIVSCVWPLLYTCHLSQYEEELHMHEYYIYRHISNRGGYPNRLLNRLVPLVPHLLIPILMVSDLQTNDVALKSKNAWLAPHHGYP